MIDQETTNRIYFGLYGSARDGMEVLEWLAEIHPADTPAGQRARLGLRIANPHDRPDSRDRQIRLDRIHDAILDVMELWQDDDPDEDSIESHIARRDLVTSRLTHRRPYVGLLFPDQDNPDEVRLHLVAAYGPFLDRESARDWSDDRGQLAATFTKMLDPRQAAQYHPDRSELNPPCPNCPSS